MALSIIGYFGLMVASFTVIAMLLINFVAPSPQHYPYPHHYPISSFAKKSIAEKKAAGGASPAPASVAASAPKVAGEAQPQKVRRADAERSKRIRQARYEKRKVLTRERADREYSTALGYAQVPSYGSAYGPFAAPRF